jgi:hypothetical protein
MTEPDKWPAPIANYYGRPTLQRCGETWRLVLDSYDHERFVEVSEAFAQAWIAQFPPPAPVPCWDCEGSGKWPAGPWGPACPCVTCDGAGVLPPDEDG